MFPKLRAFLGETAPVDPRLDHVDATTEKMLRDLGLPDPLVSDPVDPAHASPLARAQECLDDWTNEGFDVQNPLRIVYEALFENEGKAKSYLAATIGTCPGFKLEAKATRPFVRSIAATVTIEMTPVPEDIAKIASALSDVANGAGGRFDGYYLEGHSEG